MGTHYKGSAEEVRALDAFIKLMRAASTVRARLDEHLREIGITELQLGVLEALLHLGPLCQHELGRKQLTSRANVTLLVDRLEDRGWVRRERDAEDRRSVRVRLTEEGRRFIEEIFPRHLLRIREALDVLSLSEQEELGRLCRKLGLGAAGK